MYAVTELLVSLHTLLVQATVVWRKSADSERVSDTHNACNNGIISVTAHMIVSSHCGAKGKCRIREGQ